MKKTILGIKIDDINMTQALEIVQGWLSKGEKHYIVTPNPEFLVAARQDPVFTKILNDADLAIPDGVGLKLSGMVKNTFSGTDFMEKLVELATEKGLAIGLLGGKDGVAVKTAERLRSRYPNLKISYALVGPVIPAKAGIYTDKQSLRSKDLNDLWIPDQVRDDKVDILFVAFGHIKQEKWIANNLEGIPVKIAMGVGGAFDYISGIVPRAPGWVRGLGFEWLFRLIIQPWRIKRQLALVKYLWLLISS